MSSTSPDILPLPIVERKIFSVRLPVKLHRRLKVCSAVEGETMEVIVEKAIVAHLASLPPQDRLGSC